MFAGDRISLSLHASRRLGLLLGAGHGVAAGVPWTLALPWWLALAASAAILALGANAIAREAARRLPSSIVHLELETDGTVTAVFRSGGVAPFTIGAGATVVPWGVVISLVPQAGRQRGVVVFPDACSGEDFRRLKVFLRWRLGVHAGPDATAKENA